MISRRRMGSPSGLRIAHRPKSNPILVGDQCGSVFFHVL